MLDDGNSSGSNGAGSSRGRKPKNVSHEERSRRNLENQRAFRQRKEEYIKSIQQENESLKAQLAGQGQMVSDPRISVLENRILALETENTLLRECGVSVDLKASFGPKAVNICSSCANEKVKTLVIGGHLQRLQEELKQIKTECNQLRTANSLLGSSVAPHSTSYSNFTKAYFPQTQNNRESPATSRSTSSLPRTSQTPQGCSPADPLLTHMNWWEQLAPTRNNLLLSASQQLQDDSSYLASTSIYGPPETSRIRRALKSIPSISQSPLVDSVITLFETVCASSDPNEVQRLHIQTTATRGRLFDQCTLLDRRKAIEEWTLHLTRNWDHVKHKYSCFEYTIREPVVRERPLPELGLLMREKLLSIPVLRDCIGHVDDFLTLFYNPNVKGTGELTLLKMLAIAHKMETVLRGNLEDYIKYSLIVEMGRESGKGRMDELLEDITFLRS
ncbi:hypothetical protein BCR33DRAFT_856202 [Rhizoclosmatium globosum]|uniref:BZIP domain-containing protein n=1 Tax=Rhizoclosmatium globosum TaxID=329046 RepID=A0A1Y2BFQ1_9FUNG|nr:hypothetical protein BCR33DRAFT_856202 [Rhizoclosmatium globosum]|eukprot:ORY33546.1 hypothetical protein BCR33DRAFT_856202 [Rhizoclosmatium globosum]